MQQHVKNKHDKKKYIIKQTQKNADSEENKVKATRLL